MTKTEIQNFVKEEGIGGGEKRRKTGRREKSLKEKYTDLLYSIIGLLDFLSNLNSKNNSFRDKLKF